MILSGLPHKEVVKRSGVSSGTVSLIRQEIRAVVPLYRNSDSGLCVPFACLADDEVRMQSKTNPLKTLVGPAGLEPATRPL